MEAALVHFEVLGPRAGADAWLATLQDAGTCHLADALHGLEGEAGIGRPRPREEELLAADLRASALLVLRGLAGVLPAEAAGPRVVETWSLPPGGVDEPELAARCERVIAAAQRVRRDLEAARDADRAADAVERTRAVVRAAAGAKAPAVPARAYTRAGSGAKRLLGRIARAGARARVGASGAFEAVAIDGEIPADAAVILAKAEFVPFEVPADVVGLGPDAALTLVEPRLRAAQGAVTAARAELGTRLHGDGAECRRALDGLEDADARERAQRLLASTGHVAAARVYVAADDATDLVSRLERAHGQEVVVRPLAPAGDAPSPVRALPAGPLDALAGLWPARFDERAALGSLVAFAALVAASLLGDLLPVPLFLLGGWWLGRGSALEAPRRQAARLAFALAILALPSGLMTGRIAGVEVLELPSAAPILRTWAALDVYAGMVAAAALALAAYGLVLSLLPAAQVNPTRRRSLHAAHRRCALVGFVAYALFAGGSVASWIAVGYTALLVVMLHPADLRPLARDVVGSARMLAVVGMSLVGSRLALDLLGTPMAPVGAILLAVALAVLVLETAVGAMGGPYDVVLGTRGVAAPFTPFARVGRASGTGGAP